ncbi:hypothetical protein AB1K84_19165 [Mesobacillus foraminis]|uniref:hypothetical protein n=1 Tax=Mesobacillus foraminis TaxID=279826 RepID=UPI00399FE76B
MKGTQDEPITRWENIRGSTIFPLNTTGGKQRGLRQTYSNKPIESIAGAWALLLKNYDKSEGGETYINNRDSGIGLQATSKSKSALIYKKNLVLSFLLRYIWFAHFI